MVRIKAVTGDTLVECGGATTADLPQSSNAWTARKLIIRSAEIPD
jgi:hypothetical protein